MRDDPYKNCPRLPAEGDIDPRQLFTSLAEESSGNEATVSLGVSAQSQAQAVELEIGPGRGWFTVERLEHDSRVRIVGLEIKRKWASIVDERLGKRGLSHRGRVFAEDARLALPRFVEDSVSKVYLHFPDPWWKKRHLKRLVLGDPFLIQLARILIPGGELLIQTDVFERADEYESLVNSHDLFEPWEDQPRVEDHPHGARSPRERKAIEDGLPIARLRYRRIEAPPV